MDNNLTELELENKTGDVDNKQKDSSNQNAEKSDVLNVKLGLIIPHRELAAETTIEKLKEQFMNEKAVSFLSDQFNGQEVKFNVVELEVISEATATILDEVINNDYSVNAGKYHPATMSIAIDIGSFSTDFVSMLGVDIVNDSEKRLNVGVDDLIVEIMNKIEEKYDVPYETLDIDNIASSLRYYTVICEDCGTIVSSSETECKCGGKFVPKSNIVRIGRRGFDVTDILNECSEKITNKIVEYFSTYIRRIFRLRGLALNQLENITLSGGGTELFGDCLKEKLERELGEFVTVKKADKPTRKNVNGLSKLIYHSNKRDDIDVFVAVDVGCSAAKSEILDKDGNRIIKGIEIPSRISAPVKMSTYSIRKVKPLADLHVAVSSENHKLGDGEFLVGQLALKGEGQNKQSDFISKCDDKVFYVLANTSIATLIARHNHKLRTQS